MMRRGWVRFLAEAAFIVAVAVVARLAELGAAWIIVLVLVAWLLTALVERTASERLSRGAIAAIEAAVEAEHEPLEHVGAAVPAASSATVASAAPGPQPGPEPEPARLREPGPAAAVDRSRASRRPRPGLLAWLGGGRRGARRPARFAAQRAQPEPRRCVTCGRPIPPERLEALPEATQCLECKRAGATPMRREAEPEPAVRAVPAAEPVAVAEPPPPGPEREPEPAPGPERAPERAPEAPAAPAPAPTEPRCWNVWELERAARGRAGRDVARDEEWGFLLVYLREFADPAGNLPPDFDALVRESFAELLRAVPAR